MITKWRVGIVTFVGVFVLGLSLRAAELLILRSSLNQFVDVEALGVLLMASFFVGLGGGSRA